jgi:hypothetical protein
MNQVEEKPLVRQFEQPVAKKSWQEIILPSGIILFIIAAGLVTGYFLANRDFSGSNIIRPGGDSKSIAAGKEMGIKDEEHFPDSAMGRIEINDSEQVFEGSHKLVRPGGESQTAYLNSSVVNLNQFVGECVEVWGETFSAQSAGWLMDVGLVKVLNKCPEGI